MKKNLKKLSLRTETVRQLQDAHLAGVAGGAGWTFPISGCACPPKPTRDPGECTSTCPQ
jgi:hypothetical protein